MWRLPIAATIKSNPWSPLLTSPEFLVAQPELSSASSRLTSSRLGLASASRHPPSSSAAWRSVSPSFFVYFGALTSVPGLNKMEKKPGIIDAIACRMGKKEAIPSGKVQDLLLEDVKKLNKRNRLLITRKIDNWTTKAKALEEQIRILQHQLAAANEKLKGEEIFNPSINEGGSPPLSDELHEWSDYLKTSFIMEKPDERREASRTSNPGTKDAVVQAYLNIFNSGSKEELIRLHPFTSLDDVEKVGVSTKTIKKLLGL
ncbi:hypothetical protein NL676_013394 [Syzygium grande]|nr:hypothetical protein NL676_013394 [Syzygium grande]